MVAENPKPMTPPYVPYTTFSNFINKLAGSVIPAQIDPSMMMNMSGGVRSALMRTLEYLKLIEKGGKTTAEITQLVESDEKNRETILRYVLMNAYSFLFSGDVDLKRATTKQVEEAFRAQGAQGSTTVKCIAFFLAAAKAAGIQVSAHVKTPSTQRGSTPKRSKVEEVSAVAQDSEGSDQRMQSDARQLRLPVPGKDDVILVFPKDFGKADWDFLKPIFEAYLAKMFDEGRPQP
jgi:hypothetical protein